MGKTYGLGGKGGGHLDVVEVDGTAGTVGASGNREDRHAWGAELDGGNVDKGREHVCRDQLGAAAVAAVQVIVALVVADDLAGEASAGDLAREATLRLVAEGALGLVVAGIVDIVVVGGGRRGMLSVLGVAKAVWARHHLLSSVPEHSEALLGERVLLALRDGLLEAAGGDLVGVLGGVGVEASASGHHVASLG